MLVDDFFDLSSQQQKQFAALEPLYREWNDKINVISRKDIDNFYERHVLHSLSIALFHSFAAGARVLDVGTGGGFPGIPLAILFPQTKFHLIDSIGKKIRVVNEVASALGLQNVTAEKIRAEQVCGRFDFVVSRAVTTLPEFYGWVKDKTNNILYIKGGDVSAEIAALPRGLKTEVYSISDFLGKDLRNLNLSFFETKKVVHIYK
jgi:16S rRNA (guanine527-N7)-methyltransferase